VMQDQLQDLGFNQNGCNPTEVPRGTPASLAAAPFHGQLIFTSWWAATCCRSYTVRSSASFVRLACIFIVLILGPLWGERGVL
jgi:hypothetical protein